MALKNWFKLETEDVIYIEAEEGSYANVPWMSGDEAQEGTYSGS